MNLNEIYLNLLKFSYKTKLFSFYANRNRKGLDSLASVISEIPNIQSNEKALKTVVPTILEVGYFSYEIVLAMYMYAQNLL